MTQRHENVGVLAHIGNGFFGNFLLTLPMPFGGIRMGSIVETVRLPVVTERIFRRYSGHYDVISTTWS